MARTLMLSIACMLLGCAGEEPERCSIDYFAAKYGSFTMHATDYTKDNPVCAAGASFDIAAREDHWYDCAFYEEREYEGCDARVFYRCPYGGGLVYLSERPDGTFFAAAEREMDGVVCLYELTP